LRHANVPANLLDRQFAAERPNQKWVADYNYIWLAHAAALAVLLSTIAEIENDLAVTAPSGRLA